MAEENRGDRSGSRSDGRNRRRRYYKRKGGDRQGSPAAGEGQGSAEQPAAQSSGQPVGQRGEQRTNEARQGGQSQPRQQKNGTSTQQSGQSAQQFADSGRTRGVRKRRRSRARRGEFRPETPLSIEKDQEYIAPKSVYVYTHVARPSSRESYEFRSEHFSRVGHTLDDYQVDLTLIFDTPRPDFGAKVAAAFSDMEAAGDIATEARFQPWVEHIEGEVKQNPANVEGFVPDLAVASAQASPEPDPAVELPSETTIEDASDSPNDESLPA
jgi:hypothetical protein